MHAAVQLSADLPDNIIANAGGSHLDETEYLLYQKLFALWDQFSILDKMTATEPAVLDADGRGHWKRRLEVCLKRFFLSDNDDFSRCLKDSVETLFNTAVGVMSAEWGVESIKQPQEEPEDERKVELRRLRKIFIPEITFRLTRQLITVRPYLETYVKRILINPRD